MGTIEATSPINLASILAALTRQPRPEVKPLRVNITDQTGRSYTVAELMAYEVVMQLNYNNALRELAIQIYRRTARVAGLVK